MVIKAATLMIQIPAMIQKAFIGLPPAKMPEHINNTKLATVSIEMKTRIAFLII